MQSPVLFIVLLGVLITVHELGHFLIAKLLNVKVIRFSVGFGPKLFGFTRGETEYQVAALPLGGYVKMAGELPHDEVDPEDASRGFLAQPPWKRALIVIGGPLFNLVFPVVLFFLIFFGAHERYAPLVGYVEEGSPAAEAGLAPGDRITSVAGEEVQTWDQVVGLVAERPGVETSITVLRDGEPLTLAITPEAAFASDVFSSNKGRVGVALAAPPPLLGVPPNSAAAAAGLKTFDQVVSINGQPVPDVVALERLVEEATGPLKVTVARLEGMELPGIGGNHPRLVTLEVPKQEGRGLAALGAERGELYLSHVYPSGPAAKLGLRIGDRLVSVNGEPLTSFHDFVVALAAMKDKPFEVTWQRGTEVHQGTLAIGKFETVNPLNQKVPMEGVGVAAGRGMPMAESPKLEKVTVSFGVWESVKLSAAEVPRVIGLTVGALGRLITADLPFDTVGGPIMMYQLTSKTAEQGADAFLNLMAVISVNLGIMNLLPIPILDGFALLAAIWEAIRRRPIPMRVREVANMVGLAMLVVLMVFVFKNDIFRVLGIS